MSTATTGNGHAVVETTLPATQQVTVNGSTITADAKLSGKENIWYEAYLDGEVAEGADIVKALLATTVTYQGEVLRTGKRNTSPVDGSAVIALSQPSLYGKDHEKAGQPVPNTGGNPVISFVKHLPNFGGEGVAYQVRVTCTGIEDGDKRFIIVRMAVQTALKGRTRRQVGHVDKPLQFG